MKPGDFFQGTVAQNIYVGNVLAIPRGAQVTGRVADVKKAGELKGGASIALQLTSLNLGGNSYSLASDIFDTSSPGKGGYTAGNTVGVLHWAPSSVRSLVAAPELLSARPQVLEWGWALRQRLRVPVVWFRLRLSLTST